MHRSTRQRQVILDEVKRSRTHPTADEIYEKVRTRLPHVSLGTVYRNLDVLAANGDIVKLVLGRTQMRFDGNLDPHYHMSCIHCGRVEDLPMGMPENPMALLEKMTRHLTKYGVFGHKLEFVGVCTECSAKGLNFPGGDDAESDCHPEKGNDPSGEEAGSRDSKNMPKEECR
ncbi:MAG: transcriptional repressor [Deltaproteobacteria bacterium]|nr:transcriptional repressor [Deltaproteobacteria bacterium]